MFKAHDITNAASKKSAHSESSNAAPEALSRPNGPPVLSLLQVMSFVE